MFDLVKNIILETRPRQWVKNLTIFVFLIFSPSREFFVVHQFLVIFYAFCIFTLLTSSVYIFNDLIDLEADQANPEKQHRPIASGKIPRNLAVALLMLFFVASLILAFNLSEFFFAMCILYAAVMGLYTIWLKNLVIFDALVIASGFVIRVLAGAFVINVSAISSWVIIITISLSLLLAFGKRRSELTLLRDEALQQRKVLAKYPVDLLNTLISALVASTFLSYILLTFQTNFSQSRNIQQLIPFTFIKNQTNFLSRNAHLLKFTIPIVFYGMARYLYIIYTKKYGGTPERALFSDLPLLGTVVIWLISIFVILYALG